MTRYAADVWGTQPTPEHFQHIEADSEQEAREEARELSTARMITNIEVEEVSTSGVRL